MSPILDAERAEADRLLKLENPADRNLSQERIAQLVKAKAPPEDSANALRNLATPLQLDLDAEEAPPEYVIEGMFEVETVNLVSGDTGTAKSILFQDMTVAAATGRTWIGRKVHAERVLYIDEENPRRTVRRRLRALGARNDDLSAFRYINRQGVELGTERWDAWLRAEIEAFRPDLVVIDTAMSATTAEVNENDSVVALYKSLRPIVSELGTCAVILHHNRKDAPGGRRGDPSQAALGARQWAGQADQQFTLRTHGDLEIAEQADGSQALRRELILEGGKDREGIDSRPEQIVVLSHKSPRKALLDMEVKSEGHIARGEVSRKDQIGAEIVSYVREEDRVVGTAEIARAVDMDPDDGTFKAALRATHTGKKAHLEKPKKGHYAVRGQDSGGLPV